MRHEVRRDIHARTGILDFERGREDRLTPYPWQTDTSVGTWFYHKNSRYTPAGPAAWKTVCVWQIQMAPVLGRDGQTRE